MMMMMMMMMMLIAGDRDTETGDQEPLEGQRPPPYNITQASAWISPGEQTGQAVS